MKSSKEFWKVAKSFQGTINSLSIGSIKDLQGLLLTEDTLKANVEILILQTYAQP